MSDKEMNAKWAEVLDFARQHATGKGLQTGIKWLEDSFNEYYSAMDTPGIKVSKESAIGHRQLLAQRVAIECIRELTPEQLKKLDAVLDDIAKNPSQSRGLKV